MVFRATGQLGAFLQQSTTLTVSLLTLLTIALALGAAVALDWAVREWHEASLWFKARHDDARVYRQLERVRKRREAVIQKREQDIEMLRQHGLRLLSVYREFYGLGAHIGARQAPPYFPILKIAALSLFLLAACIVTELLIGDHVPWPARLAFYTFTVLAIVSSYSHRVLRLWSFPTPPVLYRWRGVRWRLEPKPVAPRPVVRDWNSKVSLPRVLENLSRADREGRRGA